jgi:hypothetical protein
MRQAKTLLQETSVYFVVCHFTIGFRLHLGYISMMSELLTVVVSFWILKWKDNIFQIPLRKKS